MSTDKFENIRPSFFMVGKKQALVIAGTVQPFAGDNSAWGEYKGVKEKDGWAVCDGTVLKKADFPDLYDAIGDTWNDFAHPLDGVPTVAGGEFALPNYKGLFLGGAGNNGSTTYALGTFYDDATAQNGLGIDVGGPHANSFRLHSPDGNTTYDGKKTAAAPSNALFVGDVNTYTDGTHQHTVNSSDAETRPKTAAVNYIICIVTNKAGSAVGVPEATEDSVGVTYETPRDNLIINGSMETWQRGTSLTYSDENVSRYLADRFAFFSKQGLNATYERVENGNDNIVSKYAAKVSNLENGTMENNTLDFFYQTIEASMFRKIKGATFTVSFWVRSSKAGQHSFVVRNLSNNESLCMLYSITSPNVDQKIELTFKIPEDHTVSEGNNGAMVLRWGNRIGPPFIGEKGWSTGDFYGTSGQVQLFETAGDYIQIAEVKLEEGPNATAFKRAGDGTYATELALCLRYYEKTDYGIITHPISGGSSGGILANGDAMGSQRFLVRKRTAPTVTTYYSNANFENGTNPNTVRGYGGVLVNVSYNPFLDGFSIANDQGGNVGYSAYTFMWAASAEF